MDYSGLFNGNVSKANIGYQLTATTRQDLEYRYGYDGLDRLVEAQTPTDPDFAAYNYDSQGRLTFKKEGTNEIPQYAYVAGKNQLNNLPGHSNPIKAAADNYVYDPEGNLVLDRSKNIVIDYDYQGLPVAFRTYNSIPTEALTWLDVQNNCLATNFGKIQTERLEVVYDPFGQRTLKKRVVGTAETWTAYVGEFSELTATVSAGPWTLSSVNHWTPMGLRGRRESGGAEFLYLTDAQGSVRMGLNSTGAVVDARDYRPYGQPDIFVGGAAGKSRQGYTNKELDGETGLTYFGARYLDQEVGVWTAVDPMEQYHNSYSFVGGDPINFIDRWGLEGEPLPQVNPKPGDATHTINNIDVKGIGPSSTNIVVVTPMMNIDVDRSNGDVPAPAGLGPLDLAQKGLDEVQEGLDELDFQKGGAKVFRKAEAGGFRDENGKVNRGAVAKASLILTVGVLVDAQGRVLRGAGPSSRALARALRAAGNVPPPGSAAHHIVSRKETAPADPARAILSKFGIGINAAENGVFLPAK